MLGFQKHIVFANTNAKAMAALDVRAREVLQSMNARFELRGWVESGAAASKSKNELRRNGMQIEASYLFSRDFQRLGERFSLDWIRQMGAHANEVFAPYLGKR